MDVFMNPPGDESGLKNTSSLEDGHSNCPSAPALRVPSAHDCAQAELWRLNLLLKCHLCEL